jgi:hypothetical protein
MAPSDGWLAETGVELEVEVAELGRGLGKRKTVM